MQYIVNVASCIQRENYEMFFYEPTAKHKLELFDAKWDMASLSAAFSQIASDINRRELKDPDNQVIVCVRSHPKSVDDGTVNRAWRDTSLYAKTLVARALERSKMASVLTSSYTRKVKLVFQAEQEYFGTVEQISEDKEEQIGLLCFLSDLQSACDAGGTSISLVDSFGLPAALSPNEWEKILYQALLSASEGEISKEETSEEENTECWLRKKLLSVIEEEKGLDSCMENEEELPEQEADLKSEFVLEQSSESELALNFALNPSSKREFYDKKKEIQGEYISHRLRSLIDGSKIGRVCECLYWPIAIKSSQAGTIAMLGLTELLCTQKEITKESIKKYQSQGDPYLSSRLQTHFSTVLSGYRYQLQKKRQQLLSEIQSERSVKLQGEEQTDWEQSVYHQEEALSDKKELSIPSAPAEYTEHLNTIKMQLSVCKLSLHEKTARFGRQAEMRARIEQASKLLAESVDGLETELITYQKSAAKTLYRGIEQTERIGFETKQESEEKTGVKLQFGTLKKDEQKTEESAKKMIAKWTKDMGFLLNCAKLTDFLSSFLYLCGCVGVVSGLYFCLHRGQNALQFNAGFCVIAVLALFLAFGSVRISSYFLKEIRDSYDTLQKRIEDVVEDYALRAKDYEESLQSWLSSVYKQQMSVDEKQLHADQKRQTSARSWHLSNMKRLLDLLSVFGLETNTFENENENLMIASRIVQPMDYQQKELGNEIYWPVWAEEGGNET